MTRRSRRDAHGAADPGNGRGGSMEHGWDEHRHPGWERLNDLVDGRLDATADADVRAHLAACEDCRAQVDGLRRLGIAAAELPSAIDPPGALWDDVATTIAALPSRDAGDARARPRAPLAAATPPRSASTDGATAPALRASDPRPASRYAPRHAPRWLAAAALVLMALSSGLTALYLQRPGDGARVAARADASISAAADDPAVLPASFSATESAYLANVAELEALLDSERAALAPATVAVVEAALATIDAAIAEARTALLADPANHELAERLGANYRQKVELLRRAAEFPRSL
jgi:hypothetical protein